MIEDTCAEMWQRCLIRFRSVMTEPDHAYQTWIKPLQLQKTGEQFEVLAPNRFVKDWVLQKFWPVLSHTIQEELGCPADKLALLIGEKEFFSDKKSQLAEAYLSKKATLSIKEEPIHHQSAINHELCFDSFVEGNSNQLALAASLQVGQNPGHAYNPLFIYGDVGLGKTHLIHAIGHAILKDNPKAKVVYLHSERFVQDMVKALQSNKITEFKRFYRSVDALLIDDIQFFSRKDRSQEEFFHTFNTLLEGERQVVLTSDRYPKEIAGVEERLKSRFGWGLTVSIEPPELETRVAILMSKAERVNLSLPYEVAFFIAKRIRSNVRELEGGLKRVIANSHFTGQEINIAFVRETLKDLITLQDKLVTIDNIQKTVADYYHVKITELLGVCRERAITRPRQLAMALAKELTNHSLPEIGLAFGGRDHTTVLHACRQVEKWRRNLVDVKEDWLQLNRLLST